jgi:hypothetical protein
LIVVGYDHHIHFVHVPDAIGHDKALLQMRMTILVLNCEPDCCGTQHPGKRIDLASGLVELIVAYQH